MLGLLNSPFREASAGNFTKGTSVLGVISNTNVLNAVPHTQHLNVVLQNLQLLPHAQSQPTPLPTPIRVNELSVYLANYPLTSKQYIINGFLSGFSLDYVGPRETATCVNLLSALQNPDAANEKLNKE